MTLKGLPSGAAGRYGAGRYGVGRYGVGARRVAALAAAMVLLGTGCAQASAHSGSGARAGSRTRSDEAVVVTAGSSVAVVTASASAIATAASAATTAAAATGSATATASAAAGPAPAATAGTLAAENGPEAAEHCPTTMGRIACVDLTRQLMWVQAGRRLLFGPVRVRTGRAGYVTRPGLWHIYFRNADQWSSLYDVAMPYSQFFSGGEAFHGLNGESMSTPPGSHGCVNMNTWDARSLWGILRLGDPVMIFGRRPGT